MDDPRVPDMSKRETLLVHIEGLQATLTKRNARIAELETQLSTEGHSPQTEGAIQRAYREGWRECASHLINVTRDAALALRNVSNEAWNLLYAEAEGEDS